MAAVKNNFSSNVHNFAKAKKGKKNSKCKNDITLKKLIRESAGPLHPLSTPLKTPAHAPYFLHPLFKIFQIPFPLVGGR